MPPAVFYVARQRFFDNSGVVVTLGLGVSAGLGVPREVGEKPARPPPL